MATNPLYYSNKFCRQLVAANPTVTTQKYLEGFNRTRSLVNVMIGVANEVARLSISDGITAIRQAGLYRQKTKQLCNETLRRQEAYEAIHNSNFGDRLSLWLDYLDGTEEEYRRHIFILYNAIKMALDKHQQRNTELKAKLECGRICAEMAVGQFDALMKDMQEHYSIDYTQIFIKGRYTDPLHTWQQVCDLYVKTDDPDEVIDLNQDANLTLAADVLAKKLNDATLLNRLGKHAIELNIELAKKYVSHEDLQDLGITE